jgi:hypothetical protein
VEVKDEAAGGHPDEIQQYRGGNVDIGVNFKTEGRLHKTCCFTRLGVGIVFAILVQSDTRVRALRLASLLHRLDNILIEISKPLDDRSEWFRLHRVGTLLEPNVCTACLPYHWPETIESSQPSTVPPLRVIHSYSHRF